MTTDQQLRQEYLREFDFETLFIEELGWDVLDREVNPVSVEGFDYVLTPVAEKFGFAIFECSPDADGNIPATPVRRKIDTQVAKIAFEHMIIFADAERTGQTWQWVKREVGKEALRQISYAKGQSGLLLLQRLERIEFDLDEEEKLGEVRSRVKRAMDVEKVTKRFYDRFRRELTQFQGFIEGVAAQGDRDWYASLMLNRMMFVYFIQKQGFLDGNTDYLRTKLHEVQITYGDGRFQQFYREFLLKLFHYGLGQPESERSPELAKLLGRVPYLNGGLFDIHELERDDEEISIPDEAFEKVFEFFDSYQWHLDDRPQMADNEINPDVLGYIFEKYINQKQMGAYYTKEDITGYITRNTVIPFLFDAAKKECPVAFGPNGGVWRLLQDDPDRYIYPAVGHGVAWDYSADTDSKRLEQPFALPANIDAGINDASLRTDWNHPAPDKFALPTEIWREVVARRKRYEETRLKLASGEVQDINDLITLNLDIERFARDVIVQSEGPELLRAFWKAMSAVSVLDPTCGSGAFLFAALNILEPLYAACIEGMRGFVDDLERSRRPRSPNALSDFRTALEQDAKHPNSRYYILKSIILNNLYGVDIMEEAVEICKLRLFLKLVAQLETYDQIEPLPDIDFNIRAGNTLVGFTSLDAVQQAMTITPDGQHRMPSDEDRAALAEIQEQAEIASRAFDQFRKQQTTLGGEITTEDKAQLRLRLDDLRATLDSHLASEYAVQPDNAGAYDAWRASHQPFHWFVEFYGVMNQGGFDVVIGNPPYVKYKDIPYTFSRDGLDVFPDIYGDIVLRSTVLADQRGRCGMIVPLSVTFSRDFGSLRDRLLEWGTSWFSSYDNIPAALFSGVSQRCTIWIGHHSRTRTFVAPMYRWRATGRSHLMVNIAYVSVAPIDVSKFGLPKLADLTHNTFLNKVLYPTTVKHRSAILTGRNSPAQLGFSQTARNFISVFRENPPCLDASSLRDISPSKIGTLRCSTDEDSYASLAALSGELFFWYWMVRGDGFDVTSWLVHDYAAILDHIHPEFYEILVSLGKALDSERNRWLVFKKNAGRYVGNFNYREGYQLTRRADLTLIAGLSQKGDEALSIFDYVQRVLAINSQAGEKGIPDGVKKLFPASYRKPIIDSSIASAIDSVLAKSLDFTDEELDYIINYDLKGRMDRNK